jgi:hypothetical protein
MAAQPAGWVFAPAPPCQRMLRTRRFDPWGLLALTIAATTCVADKVVVSLFSLMVLKNTYKILNPRSGRNISLSAQKCEGRGPDTHKLM